MHITEKIQMDIDGLQKYGPITIVAFGDSITHGAFRRGEIDYEKVYWNLLRKKINAMRNYVPVNVINAGIGGTTAHLSLDRLEGQVLLHNPDLVIVCFGLNDVNVELEEYLGALEQIFEKCKTSGADVIFMTPNMMNTYVAEDTLEELKFRAAITAEYQNNGRMDLYIQSAVKLAKEKQVTVCDCYAEWKRMSETQDVTTLLVNRINHPTYEMHELFANMLFQTIFKELDLQTKKVLKTENTMYEG